MKGCEWSVSAGSLQGPRESNQDRYLRCSLGKTAVIAIADGMGGLASGDRASAFAIRAINDWVVPLVEKGGSVESVGQAFLAVADDANSQIESLGERSGTTLTAMAMTDEAVVLSHIGDSRAYRYREGRLVPLTLDNNLFESNITEIPDRHKNPTSQEEFDAASSLTAYLGSRRSSPLVDTLDLVPDDWIVLTSDGVHGEVSDLDLETALRSCENPREATAKILKMAQSHRQSDNATVVVAAYRPPTGSPAQDPRLWDLRLVEWFQRDQRRLMLAGLVAASAMALVTFGAMRPKDPAVPALPPSSTLVASLKVEPAPTPFPGESTASINARIHEWKVRKTHLARETARREAEEVETRRLERLAEIASEAKQAETPRAAQVSTQHSAARNKPSGLGPSNGRIKSNKIARNAQSKVVAKVETGPKALILANIQENATTHQKKK